MPVQSLSARVGLLDRFPGLSGQYRCVKIFRRDGVHYNARGNFELWMSVTIAPTVEIVVL